MAKLLIVREILRSFKHLTTMVSGAAYVNKPPALPAASLGLGLGLGLGAGGLFYIRPIGVHWV